MSGKKSPAPSMPPPERRVVMGVIGAPHGVRGEVRFKSFTGDPLAIADYGVLFADDGRSFTILDGRHLKDDMLVLRFSGFNDRTSVEKLTGLALFIDRDALPALNDADEFYHADLIGLVVVDQSGSRIGTVQALHNHGAGDLLEIAPDGGGQSWLQPFTKIGVPQIDLKGKRVVIDPQFLAKPDYSTPPKEER
jgi:16S rRNA processing protein RimM